MKLCTICGLVTSGGSRCSEHPRLSNRSRHNTLYSTREWTRLSARLIRAHVGRFGWVCPGDGPEHPSHPTRDLTLDHKLTLSAGGAPLDPANLRVLCRSRNSELGARTGNALRGGPDFAVVHEERGRGLRGSESGEGLPHPVIDGRALERARW